MLLDLTGLSDFQFHLFNGRLRQVCSQKSRVEDFEA